MFVNFVFFLFVLSNSPFRALSTSLLGGKTWPHLGLPCLRLGVRKEHA